MRRYAAIAIVALAVAGAGASAGTAFANGPDGLMTGKGSLIDTAPGSVYSGPARFAYALECDARGPFVSRQNPLEVHFGSYVFKTKEVAYSACGSENVFDSNLVFDTISGSDDGTLRRPNGTTVSATLGFRFYDGDVANAGSGPEDRSSLTIVDSSGTTILSVDGVPAKFPGSRQPTGENVAYGARLDT